ncbi:Gfo/Idh/MocA family oxidoreductase [Nocardioides sp. YIM 152315]|uniref:Gfo/Idh/MocA family protein n=1 Tax=Nocardioides sp. YIM 152315 TaxID=3031760 RepID=UPI0023DCB216|nr:Gfo/Idh/MocA family oxidoreductase [Nocardioides sp. YIM 152315]MDF1605224.1 Gfo/Idh/MocA family oxidoreductase [Nocardioides sp. YIM 152315]
MADETDVLRIGLIGLGAMGRHHARVIRSTPGLRLVAVADPIGDRFGVAGELPVLPDVQAIIDAGVDGVMVAVPTSLHEEVALTLAAAGVHAMVEKPIAHSVESGERVARAFEDAGLVGAVGYVERCNPAMIALRERIAKGVLGEVYQITTSRQGPFPERINDVGVVQDLATHDVDLTPWIAGSAYTTVTAHVTYRSGRQHEDMLVASGRLANGVIVNHLVNWLSPRKERHCVVTGEKGALVADTLTGDLTYYENGTLENEWDAIASFRGVSEGDVTRFSLHKREPLAVEHQGFRDAIRGVADPYIVPMREGVETLRVVDACLRSAREGVAVPL